jgi:predicted membrane protein
MIMDVKHIALAILGAMIGLFLAMGIYRWGLDSEKDPLHPEVIGPGGVQSWPTIERRIGRVDHWEKLLLIVTFIYGAVVVALFLF